MPIPFKSAVFTFLKCGSSILLGLMCLWTYGNPPRQTQVSVNSLISAGKQESKVEL